MTEEGTLHRAPKKAEPDESISASCVGGDLLGFDALSRVTSQPVTVVD